MQTLIQTSMLKLPDSIIKCRYYWHRL